MSGVHQQQQLQHRGIFTQGPETIQQDTRTRTQENNRETNTSLTQEYIHHINIEQEKHHKQKDEKEICGK